MEDSLSQVNVRKAPAQVRTVRDDAADAIVAALKTLAPVISSSEFVTYCPKVKFPWPGTNRPCLTLHFDRNIRGRLTDAVTTTLTLNRIVIEVKTHNPWFLGLRTRFEDTNFTLNEPLELPTGACEAFDVLAQSVKDGEQDQQRLEDAISLRALISALAKLSA